MSLHRTPGAFRAHHEQVQAEQAKETRKKQLFELVWYTFQKELQAFLQIPEEGVLGEKKLFLNSFIDNSGAMAKLISSFFRHIELDGQKITVTVQVSNIHDINYLEHHENAQKQRLRVSIVERGVLGINAKRTRDINLLIFSDKANPNSMHVKFAITPPFFQDAVISFKSPS